MTPPTPIADQPPPVDLDDLIDAVARVLFRAFDDANIGHEPLHDFDVMIECDFNGRPVIDKWHALAVKAIEMGARVASLPPSPEPAGDRAATVRIDDAGDLLIEATLPDQRLGIVLSANLRECGWWTASRDPLRGGSGPIDDAGMATIRQWCAPEPAGDVRAPCALWQEHYGNMWMAIGGHVLRVNGGRHSQHGHAWWIMPGTFRRDRSGTLHTPDHPQCSWADSLAAAQLAAEDALAEIATAITRALAR